jgi:hypothetical protein
MRIYTRYLLLFSILLLTKCKIKKHDAFSGIDYSVNKYDKNICCCKYISEENASFWKKDSLGLNGFRRTITPLIQNECTLKSKPWNELKDFFGKPMTKIDNLRINNKEACIYVFVINRYSLNSIDNYKRVVFYIMVDKSNNTIIETTIRYSDG